MIRFRATPRRSSRAGEIKGERQLGQDYRAEFEISRPAFVLFG